MTAECAEWWCAAPAAGRCAGPTGAGCDEMFCGDHLYAAGRDGQLCSADYDRIEHRDIDDEEATR